MSLDALFGAETRFSILGVVQRAAAGHAVAEELLRLKPDVVMVDTMAGVIAFKQLTNSGQSVGPDGSANASRPRR